MKDDYMIIHQRVTRSAVEDLCDRINTGKPSELTENAFTMFNWAVEQIEHGRVILSSDPTGSDIKELSMPIFDRIKVN